LSFVNYKLIHLRCVFGTIGVMSQETRMTIVYRKIIVAWLTERRRH